MYQIKSSVGSFSMLLVYVRLLFEQNEKHITVVFYCNAPHFSFTLVYLVLKFVSYFFISRNFIIIFTKKTLTFYDRIYYEVFLIVFQYHVFCLHLSEIFDVLWCGDVDRLSHWMWEVLSMCWQIYKHDKLIRRMRIWPARQYLGYKKAETVRLSENNVYVYIPQIGHILHYALYLMTLCIIFNCALKCSNWDCYILGARVSGTRSWITSWILEIFTISMIFSKNKTDPNIIYFRTDPNLSIKVGL